MKPGQRERRKQPRFVVELPVVVSGSRSYPEIQAVTRDVSQGGVFFHVDQWPVDVPAIEFRMILPPQVTVAGSLRALCKGTVVRVETGIAGGRIGIAATLDSFTVS